MFNLVPFWIKRAVRCCRQCGVAGGERVPPMPLSWYFYYLLFEIPLPIVISEGVYDLLLNYGNGSLTCHRNLLLKPYEGPKVGLCEC